MVCVPPFFLASWPIWLNKMHKTTHAHTHINNTQTSICARTGEPWYRQIKRLQCTDFAQLVINQHEPRIIQPKKKLAETNENGRKAHPSLFLATSFVNWVYQHRPEGPKTWINVFPLHPSFFRPLDSQQPNSVDVGLMGGSPQPSHPILVP